MLKFVAFILKITTYWCQLKSTYLHIFTWFQKVYHRYSRQSLFIFYLCLFFVVLSLWHLTYLTFILLFVTSLFNLYTLLTARSHSEPLCDRLTPKQIKRDEQNGSWNLFFWYYKHGRAHGLKVKMFGWWQGAQAYQVSLKRHSRGGVSCLSLMLRICSCVACSDHVRHVLCFFGGGADLHFWI